MTRTTIVLLCLITAGCALRHRGSTVGQDTAANQVAVYVFTEPRTSPVPVEDQFLRERNTNALRDLLGRKKDLAIVETAARANVVIQVKSAASVFSPEITGARFDPNAIPVDVTAAGRTTRMTQSSGTRDRTLRKLAGQIERWARENRSSIVAKRPPTR